MLTFRRKILLNYIVVFFLFLAFMFPFSSRTMKQIVMNSMYARSEEIIALLKTATTDEELIRILKEEKSNLFFRVSIITNDGKTLYDTHLKRLLGPRFSQEYVGDYPEVIQAFRTGKSYNEEYSDLFGKVFSYTAMAFHFQGKTYVLRCAFPYEYVSKLRQEFERGFIGLSIAILLLFSTLTWLIIHHLSSPIHKIITSIKPYQEGSVAELPKIYLENVPANDDFYKLATTLNKLSANIKKQIERLVRERDEKAALLESLIEGVIAVNSSLEIAYVNEMAFRLLKLTNDKLIIGEKFTAAINQCSYELLFQCQMESTLLSHQLEINDKGEERYLNLVAAPINRGGAILIIQDQTSHFKMMKMRKDFVANASHELKTPITVIQGFAEMLQEYHLLDETTILSVTDKIIRSCEKMTNTIQDLLTLADTENLSSAKLEECSLLEIIEKSKKRVLEAYPATQITLHSQEESILSLIGEPHLLELAFFNLMENAAKYSEEEGVIDLFFKEKDTTIEVAIQDQGIGIPESSLPHIFERFYRVNKAKSRRMGGSGLGLAITETIIQKHRGSIEVASVLGCGTTFTLTLPKRLDELLA